METRIEPGSLSASLSSEIKIENDQPNKLKMSLLSYKKASTGQSINSNSSYMDTETLDPNQMRPLGYSLLDKTNKEASNRNDSMRETYKTLQS